MVLLLLTRLGLHAFGRSVEVRLAVSVKSSEYTAEDAGETVERLRRAIAERPMHALLVVAPSIDEEAVRKLQLACDELGLKLLIARVPRVIDRVKLAAVGKAVSEAASARGCEAYRLAKSVRELKELLDVELVETVLRDVAEDLGLLSGLKKLLEPPYAVNELFMDGSIRKYEDLVSAMKWFLFVPRKRVEVGEAFDYVSKSLSRFLIYRRGRKHRGVLALDIESLDKLKEVAAVLHRNGFVEYDPRTGIVDTGVLNPIESRVVKVLNGVFGGVAKLEDLRKFFVEISPNASRIWNAIISILELRGLLCVEDGSGRCPSSPGRGYVVAITSDNVSEYVGSVIESAEALLRDLAELERYGYVVVGKERGYRAFTLRQLASVISDLVAKVRDYSGIDASMAARLANLITNLVSYVREVVVPEVERSRERILALRRELEEIRSRCAELIEALRSMLESYVASNPVEIRFRTLEKLEWAQRRVVEIEGLELGEDEFAKIVEDLWARSRGKSFPFYFDSLATTYHYNYKLYLIHRELSDLVEISSEDGELRVREIVREVPSKLERIVMSVKSSIESVYRVENLEALEQSLRRCETLRGMSELVKKMDVTRIEVKPIDAANCDELAKTVDLVIERWVKSMESSVENVRKAIRLAEEVSKLEKAIVDRMSELATRISRVTTIISRCPALFENSVACSTELDNVKEVVEDAKRVLEELTSGRVEVLSVEDVLRREEDVKRVLENVLNTLSKDMLQNCSKLEEEVRSRLASLTSSAKSLYELLTKLRIEVPRDRLSISDRAMEALRREDYEELCVCMYDLGKLVKELRSLALKSGALEMVDLEVYSQLSELRRGARGRLSLDEAAKAVSERLCMPFERVWSSVVKLVGMRLLEVYL